MKRLLIVLFILSCAPARQVPATRAVVATPTATAAPTMPTATPVDASNWQLSNGEIAARQVLEQDSKLGVAGLKLSGLQCTEDGATLHFLCVGRGRVPSGLTFEVRLTAVCTREMTCTYRVLSAR